ncbi:MAG: molybdenum cofactor biosynthesis protein MoaB [Crenarchaeota archaeon]|nr:molybdenum cofactor biosynthesis protein MoaB [Thermoproteota archaeon]
MYWALVITSDRIKENPDEDQITPIVTSFLEKHGDTLVYRAVAGNNPAEILHAIASAVLAGAEAILVTGGTGPNPRDVTVDLVARIADRELPGIGEEFRRRSLQKGVANALLSRATAYTFQDRLIVVSPGNPDAVQTMLETVHPIAAHAVEQLRGAKHHHKHEATR